MLVEISDIKLAERLIEEGSAKPAIAFNVFYEEEIEERIQIIKDSCEEPFDEAALKEHLANEVPCSDYDFIFNEMIEEGKRFIRKG